MDLNVPFSLRSWPGGPDTHTLKAPESPPTRGFRRLSLRNFGLNVHSRHRRAPWIRSSETCHRRCAFCGSSAYGATPRRTPGVKGSASWQSSK
jgi:hypothetical protein